MSPLVRVTLVVQRAAAYLLPLGLSLGLGALVVVVGTGPVSTTHLSALALLLSITLVVRARARWKAETRAAKTALDTELVLSALSLAVLTALRVDASLDGATFALAYLVLAVAASTARGAATAVGVVALATMDAAIRWTTRWDTLPFVVHVGLSVAFATLSHLLLRQELTRMRGKAKARIQAELDRMTDAARRYRLDTPKGSPDRRTREDDERLVRSSAEEIHQAVMFSLDLVRRSLGLHTAMLLWLGDSGRHLRIAELSTDGDVLDGPFLTADGVFGAALSRRAPVSLGGLRGSTRLPYYHGASPVGSACAVPIFERGDLRGLLVADRHADETFSARDEELLVLAAKHAVRVVTNERVFLALERAKAEQGKLYRASEALGGAMSEAAVLEAAVMSAREIAAFDFSAVTLYEKKAGIHEIHAVSGDGTDPLLGARFAHNTGLVSMVVENKHPLPYKGELEEKRQVVFHPRLLPPPVASVLVLPLVVHDRPLGTLVLGARRKGAFGDAVRPTLEVLARHVAVSLANARMVKKLEDLATTDGLTGLLNKRALLESAKEKLASATRFGRKVSVVVTDIDFFKKVNDNYGHDVGDQVIKGLGDILRRVKRTTDLVARFGGEEFVALCEETDEKGAMLFAERIREELEKTVFPTSKGPLSVTCSLGVATFPEAGRDWDTVFKAADEALYASKHGGRNRSTAHTTRRAA